MAYLLLRETAIPLYHTTSLEGLTGILRSGKLTAHPFASLTERPFVGDIEGNDVSIAFKPGTFSGKVMKVEYTPRWYKTHPDAAAYVAGEGWREQYVADEWLPAEPDDWDPEEMGEWADDPEAQDAAYQEAERSAFLHKSMEREWVSIHEGTTLPFDLSDLDKVLVHNAGQLAKVRQIVPNGVAVIPHSGSHPHVNLSTAE